ncbi:UNVERIFIED_CONTAM: DNA primase, partial [Bacteroidetes bacterium 56_B9]
ATNAGIIAQHSFPYDHDATLDDNLQRVNEQLNEMEEYHAEEVQEEDYGGGMHR